LSLLERIFNMGILGISSPFSDEFQSLALGKTTTDNNLMQFYNRFGQNLLYQDDIRSKIINSTMFYDISIDFQPTDTLIIKRFKEAKIDHQSELKYFIQTVDYPSFTVEDTDVFKSDAGNVVHPVYIVNTSSNKLKLGILNTEYSLHEHIFYPWMRETTMSYWVYESRPYTHAKISIHIIDKEAEKVKPSTGIKPIDELLNKAAFNTKASSSKYLYSYIFSHCRPTTISSLPLTQLATTVFHRDVEFTFNNMYVKSYNKIDISAVDKMKDVFNTRILGTGVSAIESLPASFI
jgi:hypothetical protein